MIISSRDLINFVFLPAAHLCLFFSPLKRHWAKCHCKSSINWMPTKTICKEEKQRTYPKWQLFPSNCSTKNETKTVKVIKHEKKCLLYNTKKISVHLKPICFPILKLTYFLNIKYFPPEKISYLKPFQNWGLNAIYGIVTGLATSGYNPNTVY